MPFAMLFLALFASPLIADWPRPAEEKTLAPLTINVADETFEGKLTIARTLHKCPTGKCVLFKKTQRINKPGDLEAFDKFLAATGVRVVEAKDDPWCTDPSGAPWKKGDRGNPSFNCHSFSVGNTAGLTPADWLEGVSAPATEGTNPMQVFLDSYFRLIKTYDPAKQKPGDIEADTDVTEGDLLVFTAKDGEKLFHVHSGKLAKREGKWVMTAKLGEDFPVVAGSIEAVSSPYAGKFNEVRLYRAKPRE